MSEPTTLLKMEGICKRFGPVQVLNHARLEVGTGEIHALIGENGAGKSTLMKILSGLYSADAGSITLADAPYRAGTPHAARSAGVSMIYQELSLAPHLTVEENVTLGLERTCLGFTRSRAADVRDVLGMLGHGAISIHSRAGDLSIGEQQIVEIARALFTRARLLIMDEPTSSLPPGDVDALFDVMRRLAANGVSVIYISHFLEELRRIAHRFTVLRDGETVGVGDWASTTTATVVHLMVGRPLSDMFPRTPHKPGEVALRVRGLVRAGRLSEVSLELRAGEVLGIAGLIGAGRTELVRALFGLDPADRGELEIGGVSMPLKGWTPTQALAAGLDLLSENRKEEGLATGLSVRDNISLSSFRSREWRRMSGFLRLAKERAAAGVLTRRLDAKLSGLEQHVVELSGGNQQKIAMARIVMSGGRIVFLDEPTRGVDVGNKVEMYRIIGQWAAEGRAILMISSYLPELLGVCDSLAVMHRGRLSPVRPIGEWTEEQIMTWAVAGRFL